MINYSTEFKPRIIQLYCIKLCYIVGIAGAKAAKELGIKSIYEIRGFMALDTINQTSWIRKFRPLQPIREFEIEAAKMSDGFYHYFCIERNLD